MPILSGKELCHLRIQLTALEVSQKEHGDACSLRVKHGCVAVAREQHTSNSARNDVRSSGEALASKYLELLVAS